MASAFKADSPAPTPIGVKHFQGYGTSTNPWHVL
jgi:hypothetical protein